jgi:hypothetical protein
MHDALTVHGRDAMLANKQASAALGQFVADARELLERCVRMGCGTLICE